jgi:hypothetical protein
MVERRTLYFLSKAAAVVTASSHSRRQPKKAHRARAHIAAWRGVERMREWWRTSKCSIETGAQRGRLCLQPSLLAEIQAS